MVENLRSKVEKKQHAFFVIIHLSTVFIDNHVISTTIFFRIKKMCSITNLVFFVVFRAIF
jgi:hypothetical protein